jgi:16S rRNA (adenine1518-N6/adenine1519-N6)-dimethyltransferase
MTLLEEIKYLIKQGKISPNKLRGQNFCIDEKVLEQVISASSLPEVSNILEIGPGLGFLTEKIQAQAGRVVAVEIEDSFKKILETKKAFWPKVEIIWQDVLHLTNQDISKLFGGQDYQIITNLPYSLSGIFFRKFLSLTPKPVSITVMIQREVGERVCAKPGDMSLLGLQAQVYSQPRIITEVGPESFWPQPKVDSVIVHLDKISSWLSSAVSEKRFWQLAKIGFSSKRKTLANNLAAGLKIDHHQIEELLAAAGLKPLVRAQELSVSDWLNLSSRLV